MKNHNPAGGAVRTTTQTKVQVNHKESSLTEMRSSYTRENAVMTIYIYKSTGTPTKRPGGSNLDAHPKTPTGHQEVRMLLSFQRPQRPPQDDALRTALEVGAADLSSGA